MHSSEQHSASKRSRESTYGSDRPYPHLRGSPLVCDNRTGGDPLDQTELRAEITRLHKLISEAAQQAKGQNVTVTLIDKLTSAQIRIELLLKKLGPIGKP